MVQYYDQLENEVLKSEISERLYTVLCFLPIGFFMMIVFTVMLICCGLSRRGKKAPMGLENIRETCYLNAMIQALASSDRLIESLIELSDYDETHEKLNIFIDLLKNVNRQNLSDANAATESLVSFINMEEWDRPHQQDTFELLAFLISSIEKDLDGILKKRKMTMPPKFKLYHAFSENPSCNKVQDHLALAIPLCGNYSDPGETIEHLLDNFFQQSIIDQSPHNTVMYLYGEAPDVLILHIQANEWDCSLNTYIKPVYHIIYKKQLVYIFEIMRTSSRKEKRRVKYTLVAVVHHIGDVYGGHYICYRQYEGRWYQVNDENVEAIDFNCEVVPYVMVYEKRNEEIIN